MKSDAIPPSLDRSVSFEITPEMTYDGDHVIDEDAEVKDKLWVMSKNALQLEESREHASLVGLLLT